MSQKCTRVDTYVTEVHTCRHLCHRSLSTQGAYTSTVFACSLSCASGLRENTQWSLLQFLVENWGVWCMHMFTHAYVCTSLVFYVCPYHGCICVLIFYLCMCVATVRVCTCTCAFVRTHLLHLYVCICARMYMCVYVWMLVRMPCSSVYMYACTHVCTKSFFCVFINITIRCLNKLKSF